MQPADTDRSTLQWSAEHGSRLRQARLRQDETQAEASDRFGVNQSSYARWELGQSSPSVRHLDELAALLGVEPDDVDRFLSAPDRDDDLADLRAELSELKRELAELRDQLDRNT